MLCKKPFMAGAVPFGCGQCLPCRINKRRQWMWRQFFESLLHQENAFVTLTYDDDHLPSNGSLVPRDVTLWLYRFRKALRPTTVRYFLVGEYGDLSGRPHYHLSMFGVGALTPLRARGRYLTVSDLIQETWQQGITHTVEFNEATASYVAGYTVKKLTSHSDPKLKGRYPEFMRSSRRPGLGADAMKIIATQLMDHHGLIDGDVPKTLKLGKKSIPIDRFLLKKLRLAAGMSDEQISEVKKATSLERSLELLSLFKDELTTTSDPALTARKVYSKEVHQQILNAEARYKLWDQKRGSI